MQRLPFQRVGDKGPPKCIPREAASVVDAAQHHQRAHLEVLCETVERRPQILARPKLRAKNGERDQKFGCNPIASILDRVRGRGCGLHVGPSRLAKPEMGQLMSKCEHLRRLGVSAVDEHERGQTDRRKWQSREIRPG